MANKNSSAAQAALMELDEGSVSKFHRRILFTAGIGFFTDAYDLFIIGVALVLVKAQWHPSTLEISLVGSMALIASALGATCFGRIADLWGRRKIYGLEMLLLAGGAIATAFAPNIWWLIGLRFIVGIGVGGNYPVSATIMSEYSGRHSRGRLVATMFSMQALGLIVGPLVAIVLLMSGVSHDLAWRLMLAFGAIPALLVFRLRRRIQETPRFALAAGDLNVTIKAAQQASGKLAKVSNFPTAKMQLPIKVPVSKLATNSRLFHRLLGASLAWFLLDFAFYGNTISSPIVLKLLSHRSSLVATTFETLIIFVVAAAPGYALAIRRIDTQGRKSMQSIGFAIMALCFLGIGIIPDLTTLVLPFLLLYGISYFFTQYGPNTTTFIYPTELFPVRLRATAHGIAGAIGKIGAFIGVFLFPILLSAWGLKTTELVVAAVCVGGLIVTQALLPETKHESLEKISKELVDVEVSAAVVD